MTNEELYEFDLRGYIIFRNLLSADEVGRALTTLEHAHGAEGSGKFSFLELDQFFMDIMSRPRVMAVLQDVLGVWFRFDHAFGLRMTRERAVHENLHAGPLEGQGSFFYQWAAGRMANGLVKVLYTLSDVGEGDGGFICIPGSHKSNYQLKPRLDSHLIVHPTLRAGDALIFTEALMHGSRQWMAHHTRTALIYSYAPGYLGWKDYETIKPLLSLAKTQIQKDLLRPPYVGNYDDSVLSAGGQWPTDRRSPTVFREDARRRL